MSLMLDSAAEPSAAVLDQARVQGVVCWAGYLRSPTTYAPWSAEALGHAALIGLGLQVWVGPLDRAQLASWDPIADAHNAIDQAHAVGIAAPRIALDIERSAWDADPAGAVLYARRFGATCIQLHSPWVQYGPLPFLAALAADANQLRPHAGWVAYFQPNFDLTLMQSSIAPPFDLLPEFEALARALPLEQQQAWQYGSGSFSGVVVDYSYAGAGFPAAPVPGVPVITNYPSGELQMASQEYEALKAELDQIRADLAAINLGSPGHVDLVYRLNLIASRLGVQLPAPGA